VIWMRRGNDRYNMKRENNGLETILKIVMMKILNYILWRYQLRMDPIFISYLMISPTD